MPELRLIPLTPTTKVFLDEPVREEWARDQFEGFQNETISFQTAFQGTAEYDRRPVILRAESPLKQWIRIRAVLSVPVRLATLPGADENYLRKTPGLYPDLLRDQQAENPLALLRVQTDQWQSFWITWSRRGSANQAIILWNFVSCQRTMTAFWLRYAFP